MKNSLLSFAFPLLLLGMLLCWSDPRTAIASLSTPDRKKDNALSCGAGPGPGKALVPDEQGKFTGPLSGWGHYAYVISTRNDSTQFYFNQGLTMYYSYHTREAAASFKEAARFDPDCAMAYWGQALAMGPYYNAAYTYKMPAAIPDLLALMNRHSGNATAKEKKLIEVMGRRYPVNRTGSNDPAGPAVPAAGGNAAERTVRTESPSTGGKDAISPNGGVAGKSIPAPSLANIGGAANLDYARGMKELMALYPEDPDIRVLYIDAVMLMHAWDFWNNDGSPKEWTPEIVGLCEGVLKSSPDHPAALHYYIHLTEASLRPEAAFANAEALKKLFPGVAHMVHMSSHEYERTGLYVQGVEANDKADEALGLYDSLAKNLSLNKHSPHYYAVQAYCAFSGGMYRKGMEAAEHCRHIVAPTPGEIKDQYQYMLPVFTRIRLGKWRELLEDKAPDARWPYARVLYHFARGLAFVYTGHPDSAAGQLSRLRDYAKDPSLAVRDIPFNTPLQGAEIAEGILNGAILFSQKKYDSALNSLRQAVTVEDGLIYSEPRDWPIPARQFLGAYLLKLGKAAPAEKVYREDLVWHPGNGWSLLGLSQSLRAQHKDAGIYQSDALRSFSQAEQIPTGSVVME